MTRTVLITGSSRGVGAAAAKLFSSHGYNITINCSRSIESAESVAADCRKLGASAVTVIQADVSKESDCDELVSKTVNSFGNLDVLVNNAATTKFAFDHGEMDALTPADFQYIYATNVVGPYNLIKFAKPHLLKSSCPSVVNVASIAGISGIGSSVAYAASKGALITMTKSLSRVLGPIKMNAVCPGFIQGEWLKQGLGSEHYESIKTKIENSNPLGKTCTPEDVAHAIYFFAAEQNIVTGETLVLDGGSHLHMTPLKR